MSRRARALDRRGLDLCDDCLPTTEAEAVPAASYADAAAWSPEGWTGDWTGDVWRAIMRLRASHLDLQTTVFDCEHGLALLQRGPHRSPLSLSPNQIAALTYRDARADPHRLLGLRPGGELPVVLDRLRPLRLAAPDTTQ